MPWYWYLLSLFVLLFTLIILSEVKIKIDVIKRKKDDYIHLHFWFLYRLIHIQKKIPMIIAESPHEGIKQESKSKAYIGTKDVKNDRLTPKKIVENIKQFRQIVKQVKDFYKIIKRFLTHVHIDTFLWKTKIGTGDAMQTGVLTGAIWGIKGSIIGIISHYMRLTEKPMLAVIPDYQHSSYETSFECILRFRIGYLIGTGIRILIKYVKGGWKNAWRSSYSRLDEDSHGKH